MNDRKLKQKKEDLCRGIITNCCQKIEVLEKRIKKAKGLGVDKDKSHKHHNTYKELCEKLEKQREYLADYTKHLEKLTGKSIREEVFG